MALVHHSSQCPPEQTRGDGAGRITKMLDEGDHVRQNIPQRTRTRKAESSEIRQEGVPELGPSLPEDSKGALVLAASPPAGPAGGWCSPEGTCLGR
eukprot:5598569-Pyramimonas_sp.AAC.1